MELAGPAPDLQPGNEEILTDPFLPEFKSLGPQIFIYTPPALNTEANLVSSVDSRDQPDPHLYIVCSWMGARSRNIRKYTKAIQTRFPTSSILLLRQDGGDLFWRSDKQQMGNLAPAVTLVKSLVDDRKPSHSHVLVHILSNGGSYTACQLADAYRISTGTLLPVSALVLDSTPSLPSTTRTHSAICEYLPKSLPARLLGSAAVWACLGIGKLVESLARKEDITISMRKRLNDPNNAFAQGKTKRVYIYSQADKLIPAADVELHAEEAIGTIGLDRVQLEEFTASSHVGHVMLDENRYWGIVDVLWKEMVSSEGMTDL